MIPMGHAIRARDEAALLVAMSRTFEEAVAVHMAAEGMWRATDEDEKLASYVRYWPTDYLAIQPSDSHAGVVRLEMSGGRRPRAPKAIIAKKWGRKPLPEIIRELRADVGEYLYLDEGTI